VRQLFNWRFVAAVAALAVLALLARSILAEDEVIESVIEPELIERRIDLVEPVVTATASEEFSVTPAGVTVGFLDLALDEQRTMRIAPGTYGELNCDQLDVSGACVVLADMLGDAVVWFAIMPQTFSATVELPPILDLVDGYAVFESGWRIRYAPVIERDCEGLDIPSFSDFLRDHSEDSVTVLEVASGEVVEVRCAEPGET
jgi:hypothetical protein